MCSVKGRVRIAAPHRAEKRSWWFTGTTRVSKPDTRKWVLGFRRVPVTLRDSLSNGCFASAEGVEHGAAAENSERENPKRVRPHKGAWNRSDIPHLGKRRQDASHTY